MGKHKMDEKKHCAKNILRPVCVLLRIILLYTIDKNIELNLFNDN